MKAKKGLSRVELSDVKAGIDKIDILIPAPPLGYKYCDYYRTCPSFDYRVCIFPIKVIDDPTVENIRGCAR